MCHDLTQHIVIFALNLKFMNRSDTISHIKNINGRWIIQSNEDHQCGVAKLASEFANQIGMADIGKYLGLLHDIGKESKSFQQHIMKESGYNPTLRVEGNYHHAYVGALVANILNKKLFPLLSYPIAGHHTGLYDYDEYEGSISNRTIPTDVDYSHVKLNISLPKLINPLQAYEFNHLIRFLFSCLVDADYLDTERFMKPEVSTKRGSRKSLKELKPLLDNFLSEMQSNALETPVNIIRNQVQKECREKSVFPPGFYSLTVPTGGGKTLSSILWGMLHAIKHGKQRIIIAIPYTSIIVQTASVLRNIFGNDNVLEHHSNVSFEKLFDNIGDDKLDKIQEMKLATENWDYPIVVTTNVQLFESLFSNKPSKCRKLHNLSNGVLILDEVQTLPLDFLQPIVNALKTYQRQFGLSVLFTTASQPVFEGEHNGCNPCVRLKGIEKITEVIPKHFKLHDKLRRVNLHFETKRNSYAEIAERISQHSRVLCIVNTRKDAEKIYKHLPKDGIRSFHLSRMMCPTHVSETIEKIKMYLDENQPLRVVSTQLIEAGVDIDFPVVFRQEAGLDSVLQAAGRCNREGKLKMGNTYVFCLEKNLPTGFMTLTNNARLDMMDVIEDKFSSEAMSEYFRFLYSKATTFDKPDMCHLLESPREMMFKKASKDFRLIDDSTTSVIVNWKKSIDLVKKLKEEGLSYDLSKKIAQYSVNIYQHDLQLLQQAGALEEIWENVFFVYNPSFYNEHVGLVTDNQWIEETFIV